jgi:N6-adenosine-specific RNA methylase IME4
MADLQGVVKNPSSESAILIVDGSASASQTAETAAYIVPPMSSFVLCTLPLTKPERSTPIPGFSADHRFNLILLDPPWPNRSVRRSGHYHTHPYFGMEDLTQCLGGILRVHSYVHGDTPGTKTLPDHHPYASQSRESIAAIWVTNSERSRKAAYDSLRGAGFRICEEWIWIKTTTDGQPISPLDGLWRRPYEILVIGRKPTGEAMEYMADTTTSTITRRVIAAVPDLHSRKPNLKPIFEEIFFTSDSADRYHITIAPYSALEVFARNLTAGWWACGDEAIKFNASQCWTNNPPNSANPTDR